MNLSLPLFALAAIAAATHPAAHAAERLTVTVTHDLAIARPAETIAIPWKSVNDALPHAGIQHIVVKDASGRVLPHLNDSGNGVYVWNAPGAQVLDNDISGGRDGIFTNASRNNVFHGNRLHGVRFAIHYMYTNDSEVSDNVSRNNHDGYVIMYSSRLVIRRNLSEDDGDHGLLLNYANDARIEGNVVRRSDQCVFIYNANKNLFADNWFEDCAVGIHFTAGSERNRMMANVVIPARTARAMKSCKKPSAPQRPTIGMWKLGWNSVP